jgi:hypothetical protein
MTTATAQRALLGIERLLRERHVRGGTIIG